MSETLIIQCDRCRCKTVPSHRTRIRFGREPNKLPRIDLCGDCSEWLAVALGLVPPDLFGPAGEGPGPGGPGPAEGS